MDSIKISALCASLAAVIMLTGCATAPADAPRFSPAPPAPEGYATVYVYRLGAPPYTRDIKLSIAGKKFIDAPEQAYIMDVCTNGNSHIICRVAPRFSRPKEVA
jgi:hypothetical protein